MANGNSVKVRIDGDASDLEKKLNSLGKVAKTGLADVKAGIDMTTAAVKTFTDVASKGVNYNATIERLKTSFEVMTGSTEKAADVVERLRIMSAETPFEFTDLASTTQMLMQYAFTADEAIDRMSMLGDIAQGNKEAMNSIALGYAQMSSAGKVNLQDIKQMINGGFNPLQEISERTGESMASLYDRISKGTMSVDEITQSMVHATSEGGKFYQSMEKQSKTLNGQFTTLKDNAGMLLGSLTEGMSDGLRDQILPFTNNLISELQSSFDSGGYQGLINTATDMLPDLLGMMTGRLQDGLAGLTRWLPDAAKKLARAAPNALRAGFAAITPITQALFEVSGSIIGELIGMFPELIPALCKGFTDLFTASIKSIDAGMEAVFEGIASAIHDGKKHIAGAWVSDEQLARFNFKIDTNLVEVEETIEDAYAEVRSALQTDLLTDAQRSEIEGMIGADYDAIKSKLLSFGLTEEEAAPLAKTISEAGQEIVDAYNAIDVGVDAATLAKWTVEANGSRLLLREKLKSAELTPEDIEQVLGVYDQMSGAIKDGTPNLMQEIYDKLTDGEPDDDQTVDALKGQVEGYINSLLTQLETTYKAKLGELDTTAADYEEKKAALDEWYNTTKESITEMDDGIRSLVTELANAPTAVVQSKLAEFAELEQQLLGIEADIDRMNEKARTAAENAYNIVRSGTKTDDSTIEQAVNLKITEFALDKQAAEDARAAAIEELNASGKTGEAYEVELAQIEAKFTIDTEAAKNRFDFAFGEILRGIAKSEGMQEEINRAGELFGAKMDVTAFLNNMFNEAGNIDPVALGGVSESLSAVIGNAFDPDILESYAKEGNAERINTYLNRMISTLDVELDKNTQAAFGENIGTVIGKLLDSNLLEGSDFDTSTMEGQLEAIFSAINFGKVTEQIQATPPEEPIEVDVPVSPNPVIDEDAPTANEAIDAAITAQETETPVEEQPIEVDVPIVPTPVVSENAPTLSETIDTALTAQETAPPIIVDVPVTASENMLAQAKTAGGAIAAEITDEIKTKGESGAKTAGGAVATGTAVGIGTKAHIAVNAAAAMARAVVNKIRAVFDSHSPSRVAMAIGGDFGEGMSIGLRNSMENAVMVAKRMSGHIVTAADISQSMRVNMPTLAQDIIVANEQADRSINLYVNGKQLGRVMAADNRQAQNEYNRSIAIGVGKK